jgi:hypothetical protein
MIFLYLKEGDERLKKNASLVGIEPGFCRTGVVYSTLIVCVFPIYVKTNVDFKLPTDESQIELPFLN